MCVSAKNIFTGANLNYVTLLPFIKPIQRFHDPELLWKKAVWGILFCHGKMVRSIANYYGGTLKKPSSPKNQGRAVL